MKLFAIKTAKKGKKSVKLSVYTCYNTLEFTDKSTNYTKIERIINYQEAVTKFYEWIIQMHNIKTTTKLLNTHN